MNLPKANVKAAVFCSLMFFLIQLVGIFHHEPWMDEYQAFQIAMNSHSLRNLFYNMRQEGHPATWHLILFTITRFTHNIFAMQLVHIVIATAGIFIFFRYAPFSWAEKILISLGYFIFYEYAQISRCYVLTVFFVMCFCSLIGEQYYKRKQLGLTMPQPSLFIFIPIILFLLANTTLYGLLISGSLAVYLLFIVWEERTTILNDRQLKTAFGFGILIILLGWLFAYIQIKPPADNGFSNFIPMGFDWSRKSAVISQLLLAYFPFPELNKVQCWCTFLIFPDQAKKTLVIPSILIFVAIAFILVKKPSLLLFYCITTLDISILLLYIHVISLHYFGHFYIALFICFWLERYVKPNPNLLSFIPDRLINIIKKTVFYLIIIVQAITGLYMYYTDFNHPFADCSEAGEYITQNHLDRFPLVGGIDFVVLPLSYYTNKPIFTFERNDTARFITWDKKRNGNVKPREFFGDIITQTNKSEKDTILLCLYFELNSTKDGESVPLQEDHLDATHTIKSIKKITTPCMVGDTHYYLYLVWKDKILPGAL